MARTVTLYFSRSGQVFSPDDFAPSDLSEILNAGQGDGFTLELIGGTSYQRAFWSDSGLFDTETTLDLSLLSPLVMRAGRLTLTYGAATSEEFELDGMDAYRIQLALNNLSTVHSAGGVTVAEVNPGLYRVRFEDAGSRTAIGLTHSECGAMADRVTESQAGDGSTREIQTLDFRVQKIATVSSWSSLAAGALSVAVVTTGTSTVHQHERITLSRPVTGGHFLVSCDGGEGWSDAISVDSGAYDLQQALDELAPDTFAVQWSRSGLATRWEVARVRAGAITNALQVRTTGLLTLAGKTGTVDWSTFRRTLALTGVTGDRNARFILRTGPTISSGVLASGVTLIDSPFIFHPESVPAASDSTLSPA